MDWPLAWRLRLSGYTLPSDNKDTCKELQDLIREQNECFKKADEIDKIIKKKAYECGYVEPVEEPNELA